MSSMGHSWVLWVIVRVNHGLDMVIWVMYWSTMCHIWVKYRSFWGQLWLSHTIGYTVLVCYPQGPPSPGPATPMVDQYLSHLTHLMTHMTHTHIHDAYMTCMTHV